MSFLTSPPEIISYLLHAGAGPAPMLAASAAWDGLAVELGSAAQSFSSITSGLAGEAWQGAASAAMLSTAAQYSASLNAAATQAQTAAAQAQVVASEFESALAATVHPVVVAANRNELVQLVFSNLFGQNAPAIAATEAEYEQMWAQDVSAMVGYHGGVSAAAEQLSSWASAVQALPAQASAAIAATPAASTPAAALGSLTSAASNPLTGLLGTVEHYAINVINAPTEVLFGFPLIGGTSATLGGAITGGTATAPLTVFGGTEPLVNASVGTGSAVPLLVDTGSKGLVIPFTDVGGLVGLLRLGIPIGGGISGYSGGLDYIYLTYNASVNFGGGLVTASTPVNVELLAFPTNLQTLQTNGFTFQSFFASDGAAGVLGVGPNATGPGPSNPLQALPSPYNQGLLINQTTANPYLQFGSSSTVSGDSVLATLPQMPITNLDVRVNGGSPQTVSSIVDSGGVDGTLPSSLGALPGQTIDVYDAGGTQLLYSYTYNGDYFPTPISSGLMNTGNLIFEQHPVYINYSTGGATVYQ
jgi:PPE-repeat protein